jgi:phosphatidylserine decarboxylase
MVKDGFLYALGLGAVAVAAWMMTHSVFLVALPVLLALFFLWFFRDPQRTIPTEPGQIVSPGDGVVTDAEWIETTIGTRLRVSIFLNVFDVHVNRSPIAGTVTSVDYRKGGFMNAMTPESALTNEQTMVVVQSDERQNGATYEVAFKQIAGLLARRIVCNLKAGDRVARGQRMGLIKFGSRVDLLIPADAKLLVKIGTRVKGGSSVVAVLPVAETVVGI